MKKYTFHTVNSMPSEPISNAIYFIKTGDKFIIAVTDISGNVVHSNYLTTDDLAGLASEEWVNNQNFLTELPTHDHDDRYYTQDQIVILLSQKADDDHNHDDLYYTQDQIVILLSQKENDLTFEGNGVSRSGDTVTITDTDTTYTAGEGVNLVGAEFSVDIPTVATEASTELVGHHRKMYFHPNNDDYVPTADDHTIVFQSEDLGANIGLLLSEMTLADGRMLIINRAARNVFPDMPIHNVFDDIVHDSTNSMNEGIIQYSAAANKWYVINT